MAQALYRQGGADEDWRVYIMSEDAAKALPPSEMEKLGGLDGLCGGPPDAPGEYVPLRPEHSAELRAKAEAYGQG